MLSACSFIMEDRSDCPEECRLHFKYDYNMKFADAFTNEVKQVSVFIFDKDGVFVKMQEVEGDILKTEDYSMKLAVTPGKYHLVVWAGLDGESFKTDTLVAGVSTVSDLKAALKSTNLISTSDLHPLWHGEVEDMNVTGVFQEQMISLVKDTHRVNVILQHINGKPVDDLLFRFEIIDDNGLINYDNNLLYSKPLAYKPYKQSQIAVGNTQPIKIACAQMHTSRLVEQNEARLRVIKNDDNTIIIDIPLTSYLLLSGLEGFYGKMSSQEYLDRQDDFSMIFLLDDNLSWLRTQIIINGWTVHIDNTDL